MGADALNVERLAVPPIDPRLGPEMFEVLDQAHKHGIYTKGNLARHRANPIAEAACRGWLTTMTAPGLFGNVWYVTPAGCTALVQHYNQPQQKERHDG